MIETQPPADTFFFHIHPAEGAAPEDVERRMIEQATGFTVTSRPGLPSALLAHRVLRRQGGGLAWEILFEGVDAADGEQQSLADALLDEVRSRLAGLAEVDGVAAYSDVLRPPPDRGFSRSGADASSFADDLPGWESYASGSGEPEAATAIPRELLDVIAEARAAAPKEPDLKPHGKGFMYTGASDKAHRSYLKDYLETRAAKASPADRRKILAFLAFQPREGATSAINTYDNQIVTWGTGWSGLAWLGVVMNRAITSEPFRDALGRAGVRYLGKNTYDVVNLQTGRVITGKETALEHIRGSTELLNVLIDLARKPETRDAATEAQLVTFMRGSADVSGADIIATQALFNYVVHLRHWLSGYAAGCLEWAAPQVSGSPSPERDKKLTVLVTRYFYGKARAAKAKIIPSWVQLLRYIEHMKQDGLDLSDEPFFKAKEAPDEDPFATVPLTTATTAKPAAAAVTAPAKSAAPAETAPAKTAPAAETAPVKTAPAAETAPAKSTSATALKSPPLAGQPELEAVAARKSVLRRGVKGAAVKALQEALITLGLNVPGGADGDFGGGLERAVKAFQSSHGLDADGVVGAGTLTAVDAALCKKG